MGGLRALTRGRVSACQRDGGASEGGSGSVAGCAASRCSGGGAKKDETKSR